VIGAEMLYSSQEFDKTVAKTVSGLFVLVHIKRN